MAGIAPLAAGDDTGASNTDAPDLAKLKRYFTESEQLTQEARKNSLSAQDYYDSDQFTRQELNTLNDRSQPAIVINRIKPAINGIIGVTEKGRSDPRAWPRNPGDDDTADAATDVLRYIADFNRFKRLKQDCFKDLLVPGSMAALVGVDQDKQVTITQVRWEEFFLNSTGYQFNLNQGLDAAETSKASAGLLNSGATLKALDTYGTGLADTYGQQYFDNLGTVANRGANSANALAGEGQNYANAVSNNNNSAASASGNAATAAAGGINDAVQRALNAFTALRGGSSFGAGSTYNPFSPGG